MKKNLYILFFVLFWISLCQTSLSAYSSLVYAGSEGCIDTFVFPSSTINNFTSNEKASHLIYSDINSKESSILEVSLGLSNLSDNQALYSQNLQDTISGGTNTHYNYMIQGWASNKTTEYRERVGDTYIVNPIYSQSLAYYNPQKTATTPLYSGAISEWTTTIPTISGNTFIYRIVRYYHSNTTAEGS